MTIAIVKYVVIVIIFYVVVLQALETTWDADDPKFDALKDYVQFTKAVLT